MLLAEYLFFSIFVLSLVLLAWPLGKYIAYIYEKQELTHQSYYFLFGDTRKHLTLNENIQIVIYVCGFSLISVIGLAMTQSLHFWNINSAASMDFASAFNLATSFFTGTNIQVLNPETTVTFLTNTLGLTVQNFISPALGMAIMMLLVRAYNGDSDQDKKVGNILVDMYSAIVFVLLPISIVVSIIFLFLGTPQNFELGFAASQEAIKQIGTNGGGLYLTGSANPLATPNIFSMLLQLLIIPLLATSLCFTFGNLVKQARFGFSLAFLMLLLYVPQALLSLGFESVMPDYAKALGLTGSFLEGKQAEFGNFFSTLWATLSASTSNGSSIAAISSFQPGNLLTLQSLMALGEISLGGVGTNIVNLILLLLMVVFLSSLMIGKTPILIAKRISNKEVKISAICVLLPFVLIVVGTFFMFYGNSIYSINTITSNYITEVIYFLISCVFGNGAYMAGLNPNLPSVNLFSGGLMLIGRMIVVIGGILVAYEVSSKDQIKNIEFLNLNTGRFITFACVVIFMLGPLTLLPAFSFGSLAGLLFNGA